MQQEVEEREENEKEKRVLSLVEALKSNPKNGKSPGGGQGQNLPTMNVKGKSGKGKGKGKKGLKGKVAFMSKGKNWNSWTEKGKSKGKGKSFNTGKNNMSGKGKGKTWMNLWSAMPFNTNFKGKNNFKGKSKSKGKGFTNFISWKGDSFGGKKGRELLAAKRKVTACARQFKLLIQGCTIQDIYWLFNFKELCKRIYMYREETKAAQHPTYDEIPWPITWTLARYHSKHIFFSGVKPRVEEVKQNVQNFINKIKWKWLLRKEEKHECSVKPPKGRVVHCSNQVDAALQCWLNSLQNTMVTACKRAANLETKSNMIPLTKLGLRMLKDGPLAAVPTDKDGGFALVTKKSASSIHESILESKLYKEVHIGAPKDQYWLNQLDEIAFAVQKLEHEPRLASNILRWKRVGSLCSRLITTCKTHKPKGEVSFRNVHSSLAPAMGGLSTWIAYQFRAELEKLDHLVKDSRELVQKLSKLEATSNCYFMKLDIKDFFMSGNPVNLTDDASKLLPRGARKALVSRALLHILSCQFVTSKQQELQGRVWQVQQGTGMGLKHSGETADAALAVKSEINYACKRAVMEAHNILAFFRFRDDVLLIASDKNNRSLTRKYVKRYIELSDYFRVLCEEVSSTKITMLDIEVSIRGNKFITAPTWKPTSLGIPLCTSSAHPKKVHEGWPIALIRRLGPLSSNLQNALRAKKLLVERFCQHLASEQVIATMKSTDPWPTHDLK